MYSQYIKSLSEYQLLEANLMRSMEHVRTGYGADSMLVQSQTMTLREMTVSFAREMDELNVMGSAAPPSSMVTRFEREVLGKVSGMRRYTAMRMVWMQNWEIVRAAAQGLPQESMPIILSILDSARAGFAVNRPSEMILPDTLSLELDNLLATNHDMALAWSKFDDEVTTMYCVDLIQFFQMEIMGEMSLKSKVPMVFYFLSLVLLLSTFFFMFRSKI